MTILINLLLLDYPKYLKKYFLADTAITGTALVIVILLTVYSKLQLKQREGEYIHRVFGKN